MECVADVMECYSGLVHSKKKQSVKDSNVDGQCDLNLHQVGVERGMKC